MKAKRVTLAIALVIVITAGIASRYFHTGFLIVDKYFGDAFYTMMMYLLLSLVWISGSPFKKAGLTMVLMTALELFQLTQIPYALSTSGNIFLRIVGILLGTKFAWLDLLAYLVGAFLIGMVDRLVIGRLWKMQTTDGTVGLTTNRARIHE